MNNISKLFIGVLLSNCLQPTFAQKLNYDFRLDTSYLEISNDLQSILLHDYTKLLSIELRQQQTHPILEQVGLIFNPNDDPNIYFTVNHLIQKANSSVEFGISLNNSTAVTFKFNHSFALR